MSCKGVVPYQGPALHAPPPASAFPDTTPHGLIAITPPIRTAVADSLAAALEWIRARTGAPGITAALQRPGVGQWSAQSGLASTNPAHALPPNALFSWASAGKLFTAVVVHQLVEEGRLAYDDRLARFFPDVVNAEWITIDMLLTHTHGLYSFQADSVFHFTPGYSPPETLLAVAARHGPVHCPGVAWSYSNTGYVLLARIIESIEGRPYHEVARRRIVERLKLRHTVVLAPREIPADYVPGHRDGRIDRTFDPSMPYGAGAVVATALDMVHFWRAALDGTLLRPATMRAAYTRLYPMFGQSATTYGRGVMLYDVPTPDGVRTWLGHSGGTEIARAIVVYDPETKAFVAVAITAAVPAEAAALRLLQALPRERWKD